MSEDYSWWKVVGYPLLAASVPGAFTVIRWMTERKDKKASSYSTAADRRDAALLAEREAFTGEQQAMFDRAATERDRAFVLADRERERRLILEADRDRGWDLARHYYRICRDINHELRNTRQLVIVRLGPDEIPPDWQDYNVPVNLEDPIPRV